jgi:hypothetical protein
MPARHSRAMRVTSDLFVSALLRRVFSGGGYGAVVKRGATEAGAVFVTSRDRLGETTLYGPAAQASYDEARPDDRLFGEILKGGDDTVSARLAKEQRFDPDIWIVEIEGGSVPLADLLGLAKE